MRISRIAGIIICLCIFFASSCSSFNSTQLPAGTAIVAIETTTAPIRSTTINTPLTGTIPATSITTIGGISTPLQTSAPTLTSLPMPTQTPDPWQSHPCQISPSIIEEDNDWLWVYKGDIESNGEFDMILNFPTKNRIEGFAFDSGNRNEYEVDGCVENRNFAIWLHQSGTVKAIIEGEFPASDPRGGLQSSEPLKGAIITGLITEKSSEMTSSHVYLRQSSGSFGTMEHRFQLAGVENDTVILNAVNQFLSAVANDNRTQVAEMISFPINVNVHNDNLEIQTPQEFLRNYDRIFDPGFKEQLANTFPDYLMPLSGNFLGWIGLSVYNGGGIVFDDQGHIVEIDNWKYSELATPRP